MKIYNWFRRILGKEPKVFIGIDDLEKARGAIIYVISTPECKWWHEDYRVINKRIDQLLKEARGYK